MRRAVRNSLWKSLTRCRIAASRFSFRLRLGFLKYRLSLTCCSVPSFTTKFLNFEMARSVGSFLLTLIDSIVSPCNALCFLAADNSYIIPWVPRLVKRVVRGNTPTWFVTGNAFDFVHMRGYCAVFLRDWGVWEKKRLGCIWVSWVVGVRAV